MRPKLPVFMVTCATLLCYDMWDIWKIPELMQSLFAYFPADIKSNYAINSITTLTHGDYQYCQLSGTQQLSPLYSYGLYSELGERNNRPGSHWELSRTDQIAVYFWNFQLPKLGSTLLSLLQNVYAFYTWKTLIYFELLLGLFGCHKSSHIASYVVNAINSLIVDNQKSLVIQTPVVVGLHLFIQNLPLVNRTLTALYAGVNNLTLFSPV